MELRVINREEDVLSIEIGGENHTFMNTLKSALLDTEGVAAATYDMNPEQSGGQTEPVLTIKTEGGVDPLDALAGASNEVSERSRAFIDAYEAAT